MADPKGTDIPQGTTEILVRADPGHLANLPSPWHAAITADYTPSLAYIEFDPPVRSVEFYYARNGRSRAYWNGQTISSDSMQVWAFSRSSGGFVQTYDHKVIHSNNSSYPMSTWDSVKLKANGNLIQWCEFDGTMFIDNLKITRACALAGEPVLDDRTNRRKFDSTFKASNATAAQKDRKEHIRAGYRYPNGQVISQDLNPPTATNCGIPNMFIPLTTTDGGVLDWLMHTHPFFPHEMVTECGGKTFLKPKEYIPGPSSQSTAASGEGDWEFLDKVNSALRASNYSPVRMYVFDADNAYTMLPNAVGQSPADTYLTTNRDLLWCGIL